MRVLKCALLAVVVLIAVCGAWQILAGARVCIGSSYDDDIGYGVTSHGTIREGMDI